MLNKSSITIFIILCLCVLPQVVNAAIVGSTINYPNPFDPQMENTIIEYTLDADANVFLYIFDLSGQVIYKQGFSQTAGTKNQLTWTGYNSFNEAAGNGIYIYTIVDRGGGSMLGKGKIWLINR